MAMRASAKYSPCATSLNEQNGNRITFTQFEEKNLISDTRNDAEGGEESDDNPIIPPLLSEEEILAMDFGSESDHNLIYTEMLKNIRDESQSHPKINRREARYKIHVSIRQGKLEWKEPLKYTRNMGKGLNKVFKTVVKIFCKIYHLWENLVQKYPISFKNLETLMKLKNCHMT